VPAYPPSSGEDAAALVVSVFGERSDLARAYHRHLATTGLSHGLIGPREIPRLWSRHLFNCAALSPLIARDASLIDVGSGAGLPGLVLAIARPDLRVTLVDSLERRVTWLRTVVEDLALPVTVIRARAENVPRLPEVEPADVVTARAVAPLTKLVAWTVPLCAPHGVVLAIKGRSAAAEVEAAATALRRARVTAEILVVGTPPIEPITAVRLTRAAR
jgi:16S rRNA (guanine527-N7)-methyltransferase